MNSGKSFCPLQTCDITRFIATIPAESRTTPAKEAAIQFALVLVLKNDEDAIVFG